MNFWLSERDWLFTNCFIFFLNLGLDLIFHLHFSQISLCDWAAVIGMWEDISTTFRLLPRFDAKKSEKKKKHFGNHLLKSSMPQIRRRINFEWALGRDVSWYELCYSTEMWVFNLQQQFVIIQNNTGICYRRSHFLNN